MAGSGTAHLRPADETLLRVENLVVEFPVGRTGLKVHAVSDISLDAKEGETLGLVGESGCGKSTTGKAIMQLPSPKSGKVVFEGRDLTSLKGEDLRRVRTRMKMIFQDPISSLNPRRRVGEIVGEPLKIWGRGDEASREKAVRDVLEAVGLDPEQTVPRRPHQFSGGQCQRISIARALMLDPKLIICDEPVSALDVSVQAQIINLLADLRDELDLAFLVIAHDLSVVRHLCEDVAVMQAGVIVERGSSEQIFSSPQHEYTRTLLAASPGSPWAELEPAE
jgi:peptide/nickel transport system ATP-binding protein